MATVTKFDKDGDGAIDGAELVALQEYLDVKNKVQKRTNIMLFFAVLALGLSVAINFGLTTYAVNEAQTQKINSNTVVDKETGQQLTISQTGTNVMMGMLVPLVLNDPEAMLSAAPEGLFVIDSYDTDEGEHLLSLRVTEMSFYPPTTLRIKTQSGVVVQLDGSANGTVTRADGTMFRFCTACAPIQLKSVIHSDSYEAALAVFEAEVEATLAGSDCDPTMTAEEKDTRQNCQCQVVSMLGAAFRAKLGKQPAVCAVIEGVGQITADSGGRRRRGKCSQ